MSPQGDRRAETPANAIHARRGLIGVAVGALLASATTVLVMGTTDAATISGHSASTHAVSTRVPSAAEQVFARSAPGDCLTWSTPSAGDLARTDCASPHRFEVASAVDLGTQFAPGSP
ncbi:MAG: septum formation family protein, partial [Mycobacteriaceae bacterium]